MAKGTVKFYREDKGFGFITPDDGGEDIPFDKRALEDRVRDGMEVNFELIDNGKGGFNAVNVQRTW